MENPYTTLGVSPDASQEDIHCAYRTLVKQCHPDVNPGDAKAEGRFKTMSAANALLSDPETRDQFDRSDSWAGQHWKTWANSTKTTDPARIRREKSVKTAMIMAAVVVGAIGILRCVI